jgi:hypothetical protein
MPRRSAATADWKPIGKSRSSRVLITRVGTSGHSFIGHTSPNGVPDWSGASAMPAAVTSAGTSWKKYTSGSKPASGSRPSRSSFSRWARPWPVLPHHSPPVSPGAGIMAFTRMIPVTGSRPASIGAVKPPIDWATSTTSPRSRAAS